MIQVGIIMGSKSDLPVMQSAIDILKEFNIKIEVDIVSAHRTPKKMFEYAENAKKRGIKVIIAGAGGAAHLPGMVASITTIPVIGVPVKSSNSLDGWDSILSILQMPNGVPALFILRESCAETFARASSPVSYWLSMSAANAAPRVTTVPY